MSPKRISSRAPNAIIVQHAEGYPDSYGLVTYPHDAQILCRQIPTDSPL